MPSGGRQFQFGDKCIDCGIVVNAVNAAYKISRLLPRCKTCAKARYDSVPSRTKEARRLQYVAWKFGLTPEEYERKLKEQNHVCSICGEPCSVRTTLAVDHDHRTNQVRDLLCHRCNMVLGGVDDSVALLCKMIEYLERFQVPQVPLKVK